MGVKALDNITVEKVDIINFFKNGSFCKEFGCTMERTLVDGNTARFNCKFCGNEEWV